MTSPLEQAFNNAAGPAVVVCPVCVGPNPNAPHHLVLDGDEKPPTCPSCEELVTHEGQSVMMLTPNGVFPPTIVVLEDGIPVEALHE